MKIHLQLFTWLLIAAVLLAVASAGSISPALTYKHNEHAAKPYNFESPSDDRYTSGSRRILHPDGRIQIVNYLADKNGYVTDLKHEGEKKYQEKKPVAAYSAQASGTLAPTSPPYITTTSAPFYAAPISVITPPYGQAYDLATSSAYDDPTYVTSNVDLSTLFRETASRKFLRH